jgi:hypothetical protein
VHNCVAPFTSRRKLHKFGAEKPNVLTFLQYILLSGVVTYCAAVEMLSVEPPQI